MLFRSYFGGIENFSRDEITTLALCLQEGEISNSRLQITLDKHSYDITRMLQDLCKRGYLSQDGKARGATYHINKDFAIDIHKLEVYADDDDESTYPNSESDSESNSESSNELNSESNDESKVKGKAKIKVLVLECCKNDYCTSEKIANQTGASITYLRNIVIPKLIKEGKLTPLYEFNRHKEQAYKAT